MTIREIGGPVCGQAPQGSDYQRQADISPVPESPQQKPKALSPKSKRASVLRCFLERGAAGLNCFEAVRLAHDYVLRTTVSECKRFHGIEFRKRYEAVPNFAGGQTDCVRYWLSPEGEAIARDLLGEGAGS